MKESFLHFVWQFQQFNKSGFRTVDGEKVEIFSTGNHNTDAGPDFTNAKIKVGDMIWHGQIEIHVLSSYWNVHGHQNDLAYENVILHVVWEHDETIFDRDGKAIPTIELKERISKDLLKKCDELLKGPEPIPCSSQIYRANKILFFSMQQQAVIERLKVKSRLVFEKLERNKMNWEETAYQLLAKNFGFKVNSDPFLGLAENVPLKYLKKHSGNLLQIEAMLFGVSGLLDQSPKDEYHAILMNEYAFLAKKYSLEGNELNQASWKYLRLRPANFPSVRISQFANLINNHPHLFELFTGFDDVKQLKKIVKNKPSDYWKAHYDFGKVSTRELGGIGLDSIENLLINTAVPILAAYSQHLDEPEYMDKSLSILEGVKPEKNKITRQWEELDVSSINAFESQAMIEMYNNYCLKKRCLSCKIGVGLINGK